MINRILIRIKVVQMLYSFLLTHTDFHIEKGPEKDTADSRYAYSLYIDLLLIILELAGLKADRKNRRTPIEAMGVSNMLADNKLAKALSLNSEVRELIGKDDNDVDRFDTILSQLYSKVTSSAVYADYRKKKRPDLADEVQLWTVLLETVIASDPLMVKTCRKDSNYSAVGYRRAFDMAEKTLTDFNDTRSALASAKKQLTDSLEKAYDLYVALLLLPVYITDSEREKIEAAKEKYRPTAQDLNPNMRFVDNAFVEAIRNHPDIEAYAKKHDVDWEQDYFLVKEMLEQIKASAVYKDYMEAETTSYANDCELWRTLMRNVILPSDALAEALEAKSVYWNDDIQIMGQFVLKTIRQMGQAEGTLTHIFPQYKDEEDARFGQELFTDAIKNRDTYRGYVDKFVNGTSWDADRTAFMDIVILTTAIAELLGFPSIPIPVTLNEYIEIANYYSTPRSGQFVNGILYSIVNFLKEEGKLLKQ